MPVGRIECPPSASLPRDCSHECRVCRVTVVGLSTYAKHISSQTHKENVDAQEKEEDKEEAEEEYFDKELIQLINKRKEQSRQEETHNSSKGPDADIYQRRRDDRLPYQETGQQEWLREPSDRNWQWQNDCFKNSRPGFLHPALNHNPNRHLNNPRERAGWHINNPSTRHLIHVNVGGSWHSNAGGATSWHQRNTGRNFHWLQEGNGNFPNQHPRNCGGNWQPNSYNGNQWNYGGNIDAFPQGRNRPPRHCDTVQEKDPRWNSKSCGSNAFCNERFKWKKVETKTSNSASFPNASISPSKNADGSKMNTSKNINSLPNSYVNPPKITDDFTSDKHIEDNFLGFKMSENLDLSTKTKTAICSEKSNNPLREKPHRWSPYPSQKFSEIQPVTSQSINKDLAEQLVEAKEFESGEPNIGQVSGAKNVPDPSPRLLQQEKKTDHRELKSYRIPSLKPPLRNISDVKASALKRDLKNPLKGVKMMNSTTFGERQNRLSALNLESVRSNSYISKLRSASKNTKINQGTQDSIKKEPLESFSEVLRRAKEMLHSSRAIQSPYVPSMGDDPSNQHAARAEAATDSFPTASSLNDTLEDVSDDDLFCCGSIIATAEGSNIFYVEDEDMKTTEHSPSRSSFAPFEDKVTVSHNDPESHESDENRNPHLCQDYRDTDSPENVSDLELQKGATHTANTILPELSKLGLPVSLQRDLTRHISSRSKTGSQLPEPNLNSARRIRNVSGHRKSETDKDSGLKPTLKQILNASRRNINWEQVIQHVTKKRQELGKGLPRFGIEMVAQVQSEQEGLDFDEESDLGIESYHWEAITTNPQSSSRKRSLSESSVIVEKASVFAIFNTHCTESRGEQNNPTPPPTQAATGQAVSSDFSPLWKQEEAQDNVMASPPAVDTTDLSNPAFTETSQSQRSNVETCAASDGLRMCQNASEDMVLSAAMFLEAVHADGATDSCTSGTEQYDGPGVGKKRRATGDGSCPETSNLERNTKRRKIRGRKERSQVDQLLNLSLREEELSNSLQGIDNNLLQARSALQAAYMEVQRLMVLKQQITMEMSAMRTERIQILQGLQETYEPINDGEEGASSGLRTPVVSQRNIVPVLLETPDHQSPHAESSIPVLPSPVPTCTPPAAPAAAIPDSSMLIKQEPISPVMVEENVVTPQLLPLPPPPQAQSSHTPQSNGESSENASLYPIITAAISLSELTCKFPPIGKTSVSIAASPLASGSHRTDSDSTENHPAPVQSPQQGQAATVILSTQETTRSPSPAAQGEETIITIETKTGKKKKLRKKKTLRAAHVPENSDTEQDFDASKQVRKVKCRRPSKETVVSTSTSVEQEGDTASLEAEPNQEDNDSDSNIEVMEIRNPRFQVVEIDSRSDDEKPDSPSKTDLGGLVCSSHIETNDEVTSTSELGTNYARRKDTARRGASRAVKISSEVSSELGEEEQPTEGRFEGHQASVNAIQVFDGTLYTCSADKSVRAYNLVTRTCEGVFEGHTSKVNCLLVAQTHGKNAVLYTGSSDHTVRCYSIKSRECIETLNLGERVLCLHVRWKILYVGLANGCVVTISIKNNKQIDSFECHGPRAVSCMATSQEGARRLLLVGSYDCTISVRDAHNGLLLRTLEGHTKTVLCMKVVNDLVFSGSSDQSVHAHNIHTGKLVRIYKGHNHAVTVVNILGKVMVTASLDKFVRIYELESHDRLQVYGGHSDMIMCMAIYKSMIYTGCYDGSVQAVRLNLMQSYRCLWHGCSLIFGVAEHLKHHILTDHTNPNFQTLKCRWKNCDAFFTSRRGSKQDAIGHIERHAEEDSLINM